MARSCLRKPLRLLELDLCQRVGKPSLRLKSWGESRIRVNLWTILPRHSRSFLRGAMAAIVESMMGSRLP